MGICDRTLHQEQAFRYKENLNFQFSSSTSAIEMKSLDNELHSRGLVIALIYLYFSL